MTAKTKCLNDPSVPRLAAVDDGALVTVVDAATGCVNTLTFGKLRELVLRQLRIGGRNYLPDSEKEFRALNGKPEFVEYGSKTSNVAILDAIGEGPCVLSFEARTGGFAGTVRVYAHPGETSTFKYSFEDKLISLTPEWRRFELPLTLTLNNPAATYASIAFYSNKGYGSGINPEIRRIKLERGNVATDWTPAPEDIISRIEKLEAKSWGV